MPADAARGFETAPGHELAPAQRLAGPTERRQLAATAPVALRVRWRRRALVELAESGPVVALAERRAEAPSVKRRGEVEGECFKTNLAPPNIPRGFFWVTSYIAK